MTTEHEGMVESFLEAISDSIEDTNQMSAKQIEILERIDGKLATVIPVSAYEDPEYERWWE